MLRITFHLTPPDFPGATHSQSRSVSSVCSGGLFPPGSKSALWGELALDQGELCAYLSNYHNGDLECQTCSTKTNHGFKVNSILKMHLSELMA